jgi:hypothetical protein
MDPDDKLVWDEAYNEEYDGFVSLPTWEVSEDKFSSIKQGKACSSFHGNCYHKI